MILTTNIVRKNENRSVELNSILNRAYNRFLRDLSMTLEEKTDFQVTLTVSIDETMMPESYSIAVNKQNIHITGADNLGIIYALLFISERFLGITPFWYWNDQKFIKKPFIEVPDGLYSSPAYRLLYRGWFINDEVLLDAWGKDFYNCETQITENNAFEMAMEALLRLGGNMVIPGTDQNSHKYRRLAVDMGLWITHHHAEPLGAEMFARAYPDLVPSYDLYPELFEKLWRDAIEEQKDYNVVWNIGFRGQGDHPFWEDDPTYDTPSKRGELIGRLITRQYQILCEYVDNPVCCTNLYGEIMELYQQGHISLPEQIIYIWADNGYGKMVSRRQGCHNPRIEALPASPQGRHGIYYHASFYDLQAASHITMLPNSTQFVEAELEHAFNRGVHDFLIINCSNVRPHTYMLDKLAHIWGKDAPSYTSLYFPHFSKEVEQIYQQYFDAMLSYGPNEDDHAAEQYYHYTIRAICEGWILRRFDEPEPDLVWLAPVQSLTMQIDKIRQIGASGIQRMHEYYMACCKCNEEMHRASSAASNEAQLFEDSVLLQAIIHYKSLLSQMQVCEAYTSYQQGNMKKSFMEIGQAIEYLQEILSAMNASNHDKWAGFYDNDCLTDIKFTVYILEKVMGCIRTKGDGPHFYSWALEYMYPGTNHKVVLITNMRNHPKDWALYLAMKQKENQIR